jgi:PAS domain S-box-containing protein
MSRKRKDEIERPIAIDHERKWDESRVLTSKTDLNGIIEYANDEFISVSGYEDYELISKPHSIIQHPDMPKVIFKLLWDNLQAGNTFQALIKNMAKSGEYYWVMVYFECGRNEKKEITQYLSNSWSIYSTSIIEQVEPLYKNLVEVEKGGGVAESEKYLSFFLNVIGKTYVQYIHTI